MVYGGRWGAGELAYLYSLPDDIAGAFASIAATRVDSAPSCSGVACSSAAFIALVLSESSALVTVSTSVRSRQPSIFFATKIAPVGLPMPDTSALLNQSSWIALHRARASDHAACRLSQSHMTVGDTPITRENPWNVGTSEHTARAVSACPASIMRNPSGRASK